MREAWHRREVLVTEYGFPGAEVRDLLDTSRCLEYIVRANPDFVFIQVGGNDIVSEDRIRLREQVMGIVRDLKELLQFFKDRNCTVLLGEVFHCPRPRGVSFEFYSKVRNRVNRDVAQFFRRNFPYRGFIHFQGSTDRR